MSYLDRLTEQFQLQQRNFNQDITLNGSLEAYLESKLPTDFAEAVFVLGMELRDFDDISYTTVKRCIEIVQKIYETKKNVIEQNDKRFVQYHLGLIGMYLNPCTIDEMTKEIVDSPLLEDIIFNIKTSLKILEEVQPRAKGVLAHQTTRQYEYVFRAIEKILVDNNNEPPDLDSIYCFTDSLESDYVWHEIIRQLRNKFNSNYVPETSTTDMKVAAQELTKIIDDLEQTIQEEYADTSEEKRLDENFVSSSN